MLPVLSCEMSITRANLVINRLRRKEKVVLQCCQGQFPTLVPPPLPTGLTQLLLKIDVPYSMLFLVERQ